MIVHIDTSALVDALTGPRRALPRLTALVEDGHRLGLSTLVLFEWLRGPRVPAELAAQEALLPAEGAVPFSLAEARLAADLYRRISRPRGREIDLAIAACALAHDAALWTLSSADFDGIPGLTLIEPALR
jgi:predicted nucleic acid-binding protein